MTAPTFAPRWASPTSATLSLLLERAGSDWAAVEDQLEKSSAWVNAFRTGDAPIDAGVAKDLEALTGLSASFWSRRDAQYWSDRDRVLADKWAQALPLDEMASLGWVPPTTNWKGRIAAALQFFDAHTYEDWETADRTFRARAHFRMTREDVHPSHLAISAWMQRSENASADTDNPFNRDTLREAVPRLRALSRLADPKLFVPRITEVLSTMGVRFVVVRPPAKLLVNGATWLTKGGDRIVSLTARNMTDDQFWYTFFHEIAHVLLHSPDATFVDELDPSEDEADFVQTDTYEREADEEAVRLMLREPISLLDASQPRSHRDIVRLAIRNETSPGVVVGQFQHLGILPFSQKNTLERRYAWNGSSLERK